MNTDQFKKELLITADGSHTLHVPGMNETYHSKYGAIQESCHIFIKNGLWSCSKPLVRIFEVGYGTGLNCLLTMLEKPTVIERIEYVTVEKYPLTSSQLKNLNYPLILGNEAPNVFGKISDAAWDQVIDISPWFSLHKIKADVRELMLNAQFDIIYFDAFSPEKQANLWDLSIFRKMYEMLVAGGLISTYCAKGYVRRNMIEAGFTVAKIPGPPGKREILLAHKPQNS